MFSTWLIWLIQYDLIRLRQKEFLQFHKYDTYKDFKDNIVTLTMRNFKTSWRMPWSDPLCHLACLTMFPIIGHCAKAMTSSKIAFNLSRFHVFQWHNSVTIESNYWSGWDPECTWASQSVTLSYESGPELFSTEIEKCCGKLCPILHSPMLLSFCSNMHHLPDIF